MEQLYLNMPVKWMLSQWFLTAILLMNLFRQMEHTHLYCPESGFSSFCTNWNSSSGSVKLCPGPEMFTLQSEEQSGKDLWKEETWFCNFVLVGKVLAAISGGQYLHVYEKAPGKWIFSTCFLRLLRSLPVWPQRVHLWAFNPASGAFTIYSYSCLSPPVRSKHDQLNLKIQGFAQGIYSVNTQEHN